jgi:hypothetical protein
MTLPSLSSLRYSGFTPGPIRSSQGIVSKSWGNIYKGFYTNPNPLIIMGFTTWPGLTFSPISRIISTTPMGSIIPPTMPQWSRFWISIFWSFDFTTELSTTPVVIQSFLLLF